VLPGYLERPVRYFLPSGFTPVRITKLLTNPFFFNLLITKPQTSGFGTNLGSRAKKLRIRVPTDEADEALLKLNEDKLHNLQNSNSI
jgi:hypothetical protein